MKRKYFTEQEIAILAQNPYTDRVSTSNIKFTPAFKLLFWQEYCSGIQPTAIFRKYNYDPEILGHNRIARLQHAVKESANASRPHRQEGVHYRGPMERRMQKIKKK